LRHVEAQLQLHAHVLALLARERAAGFDAHVLRLQDADDLRHGRTDGIGAVACFAEGGAEESFKVHGRSWSCGGRCIVGHAGMSRRAAPCRLPTEGRHMALLFILFVAALTWSLGALQLWPPMRWVRELPLWLGG